MPTKDKIYKVNCISFTYRNGGKLKWEKVKAGTELLKN